MNKIISPTSIQESIIREPGNVVVSASAGTGKTFTLVQKISYEDKLYSGHKTIAAITFTIKAANEIKDRLIVSDKSDYFIGTNNSFAIEEIIKPFIRDVLQDEELKKLILKIFNESGGRFGKKPIKQKLSEYGYRISEKRISRLMKDLNIYVEKPKYINHHKRKSTERRGFKNFLNREFV